jgi:hypothetical protein
MMKIDHALSAGVVKFGVIEEIPVITASDPGTGLVSIVAIILSLYGRILARAKTPSLARFRNPKCLSTQRQFPA